MATSPALVYNQDADATHDSILVVTNLQMGSWQRLGMFCLNPRQGQLKVVSIVVHPVTGLCRGG
eukprot:1456258-Ditylum_brightwellii.AAC.1